LRGRVGGGGREALSLLHDLEEEHSAGGEDEDEGPDAERGRLAARFGRWGFGVVCGDFGVVVRVLVEEAAGSG